MFGTQRFVTNSVNWASRGFTGSSFTATAGLSATFALRGITTPNVLDVTNIGALLGGNSAAPYNDGSIDISTLTTDTGYHPRRYAFSTLWYANGRSNTNVLNFTIETDANGERGGRFEVYNDDFNGVFGLRGGFDTNNNNTFPSFPDQNNVWSMDTYENQWIQMFFLRAETSSVFSNWDNTSGTTGANYNRWIVFDLVTGTQLYKYDHQDDSYVPDFGGASTLNLRKFNAANPTIELQLQENQSWKKTAGASVWLGQTFDAGVDTLCFTNPQINGTKAIFNGWIADEMDIIDSGNGDIHLLVPNAGNSRFSGRTGDYGWSCGFAPNNTIETVTAAKSTVNLPVGGTQDG